MIWYVRYAVCGMRYVNGTTNRKSSKHCSASMILNANVAGRSIAGLVGANGNTNTMEVTRNFEIPSQIWSKRDSHLHTA